MAEFRINSDFTPQGDQPQAIEELVKGINRGDEYQTLLGVTGSGKTFTMAHVIQAVQKSYFDLESFNNGSASFGGVRFSKD